MMIERGVPYVLRALTKFQYVADQVAHRLDCHSTYAQSFAATRGPAVQYVVWVVIACKRGYADKL